MSLDATETFINTPSSGKGSSNPLNAIRPLKMPPKGTKMFYRPKEAGDMVFVIVPYKTTQCPNPRIKPGDLHWYREYAKWKGLGKDGSGTVLNNKITLNKPCAIHDNLDKFDTKRKPKSQNMILVNIYDVVNQEMLLLDYSMFNFYNPLKEAVTVTAARKNPRTGALTSEWVRFFPDPVDGAFITCNWVKSEFGGNPFYKATNFVFEKHEGLVQKLGLIDKAIDLDALINEPSYNDVLAAYVNGGPIEDEPPLETEDGGHPLMDEPFTKPDSPKDSAASAVADMNSPIDADWDN